MPLGLIGAGGVSAASDELKSLLAQRFLEQLKLRQQSEVERANQAGEGLDTRRITETERSNRAGEGLQGIGLNISQQNANTNTGRLGEDIRQFNEQAGERQARVGLIGAQTTDLNRRPEAQKFDLAGDLQKIQAQTAGQLRVALARPRSTQLVPVQGPDGTIRYQNEETAAGQIVGRQTTPRPTTGEQRSYADFYKRMAQALDDMNAVEDQLSSKDVAIIQNSPAPEFINNMLLSDEGKRYVQALRAYTLAKLRKESGAAISAGEFTKEGLVAARALNDTPDVMEQKRRTREGVAEGFASQAGPAYEEMFGRPYAPGARGGASGARAGGSVPPGVAAMLKSEPPGRYTMSDKTVWIKAPDGSIKPGGS